MTSTLLSVQRRGDAYLHVSPNALRVLTEPEHFEPLSMLVSDGYSALARANGRDLIAALPDCLFEGSLLYGDNKNFTLQDVRVWPQNEVPMRIADSSGWLTVTPPYPCEARVRRAKRSVLGPVFRRVARRGSYRIEDVAEIVAHCGDLPYDHFCGEYLWAVSKGTFTPDKFGNSALLAVYGALTTSQQSALFSGQPLPYSKLNDNQRHFAEQAVYGAQNSWTIVNRRPVPTGIDDGYSDPTEGFPAGLNEHGAIRASRRRERIVYFRSEGQPANELWYWQMPERPFGGYSGPKPRIPPGGYPAFRYEIRYHTTVTISVDVTPWLYTSADFAEAEDPPAGSPVPFEKLSPEVQKRITEELLWIRQLRDEAPM